MSVNSTSALLTSATTMADDSLPSLGQVTTEAPFIYEEDDNKYWGVNDRDVPILIGAAAGAVGLVFLILGAVLIWYLCQVVFQTDKKSLYSPDLESDAASVSSFDSYPASDYRSGFKKSSARAMDGNIRRSISAPMSGPRSISSRRGTEEQVFNTKLYANKSRAAGPGSRYQVHCDSVESEPRSRAHLYVPAMSGPSMDTNQLPETVTLQQLSPLVMAQKNLSSESDSKVRFSKSRKNRMRADSASAIAFANLASSGSLPLSPFLTGLHPARTTPGHVAATPCEETHSLLNNEAIVVYGERTALL